MSNETDQAPATSGTDGKTIAIISYITLIGWIIAFVMYSNNKSQLAIYHIRQSLFLILLGVATGLVRWLLLFIPYIGWVMFWLSWVLIVAIFVLWVIGLLAAINGEEKPVPLIGNTAQTMFAGLK